MAEGIKLMLEGLTWFAWHNRLDRSIAQLAHERTDQEIGRRDKMLALVNELHRRAMPTSPTIEETLDIKYHFTLDADDACLFVASAAMSVGIRCRFVAVRYGQSWTCQLAYEVWSLNPVITFDEAGVPTMSSHYWAVIDCTSGSTDREPDERVLGPKPEVTDT